VPQAGALPHRAGRADLPLRRGLIRRSRAYLHRVEGAGVRMRDRSLAVATALVVVLATLTLGLLALPAVGGLGPRLKALASGERVQVFVRAVVGPEDEGQIVVLEVGSSGTI